MMEFRGSFPSPPFLLPLPPPSPPLSSSSLALHHLFSPWAAETSSGEPGKQCELLIGHLRTAAMGAVAAVATAVQKGTAHTWAAGRGTNHNKI